MLRVNNLTGFGGGKRLTTLTFVDSAGSNAATITIPAAAQAGDLAVLADYGIDTAGVTDVVPAGWTGWGSAESGTTSGIARLSYKILSASDPGALITGINEDFEDKVMMVFRGNIPITTVTASSLNIEMTVGNPTQQSVTASAGAAPLVVIGVAGADGATASFSVASPAFDGTDSDPEADLLMGYKIYNSAPQDHTIDKADQSSDPNTLASGYLSVS